ncbi:MAG: bi-domain-containing oxidoreductase [Eubacteriales bacterium]|nr:bi-domain-containing oxidoreductase [Eubacteriales bacterium]
MKQIFIKKGKAIVENVPAPAAAKGTVTVKTIYSCISTGTELAGMASSARSVPEKLMEQPEKVKQAFELISQKGIASLADKVAEEAKGRYYSTGYSLSGIVLEAGEGVSEIKKGDLVACVGSGYANHAECVSIPVNLCTVIKDGVGLKEASTVALGAIALQGVRRAEVRLGESAAVIGLGAIGQLGAQMLKASGCKVIGIDIDPRRLKIAQSNGIDFVTEPDGMKAARFVYDVAGGHGADAIIVYASGGSELLSLAFDCCRKKGRVVLVGTAGDSYDREKMYAKELDMLISTSYGPGRYDAQYEEKGRDYPFEYVRWTENRNMLAYLELIKNGSVKVGNLIEKVYPIEKGAEAYESLQVPPKPIIALLEYKNVDEDVTSKTTPLTNCANAVCTNTACANAAAIRDCIGNRAPGKIRLAVIGAGEFARQTHLPNLKKLSHYFELIALVGRKAENLIQTGKRYDFTFISTDIDEILRNPEIDAVLICTRHNLHAEMAIKALDAGKAVFLEKPAALNDSELSRLVASAAASKNTFMIGFNRRFSKYACEIKKLLNGRSGPLVVNYTVNAGDMDSRHWTQTDEGGGRVIGEACHIFDLFSFLTDSGVKSVSASNAYSPFNDRISGDNYTASISYSDGSLCSLTYTSLGSKALPKEHCEIFWDNKVLKLNNYMMLKGYGVRCKKLRSRRPDKGHLEELLTFRDGIIYGKNPIPVDCIAETARLTFTVDRMVKE